MNRNHKALLKDCPGLDRPVQTLNCTVVEAERWAKGIIESLNAEQKKTAFVLVSEIKEVPVMEIHAAKVPGEFAIARFDTNPVTT